MSMSDEERKHAGRIAGVVQLLLAYVNESVAAVWLDSPQPLLGDRVPADLCRTEEGAREVRAAVERSIQRFKGHGLDVGGAYAFGRKCGECTLCCRLLPVKEFNKPANQRCTHQRFGKGCAIHASADYPRSCRLWACAWLTDASTDELARPDRSHYVLDPIPDFVEVDLHDGTSSIRVPVVQVWVDPKFPRAHEDPALRRWLAMRGERYGEAAIIRYDSEAGFVLFPPALTGGTWREQGGQKVAEHTIQEKMQWR